MEDLNRISYVAYRTARIPLIVNDPEGHFSCLKLSKSQISENSTYKLGYVHSRRRKCTWLTILTATLKIKNFLRLWAVTYGVKVIMFWKWCKIDMLLVQNTNRN